MQDKYIINEAQMEQWAAEIAETNRRRTEILDWLEARYEYHIDLAEQWSWVNEKKSARHFKEARNYRETAERIYDRDETSDHLINLIWLGEVAL